MTPTLTKPQWEFIGDITTPNIAFSGGMGAGKSLSGALKVLDLATRNQGHPGIVWAPFTRDAKEGIIRSAVQVLRGEHESGFHFNLPHAYDKGTGYITLFPGNRGGKETHIIVRSSEMDIVGTNAAWAVADELDTLAPAKARHAFQQLTQRIRAGKVNQLAVTTTPEGYRFLWEYFVQEVRGTPELRAYRKLITASLLSNPFVSDEYIRNLIQSHTPEQQRARIHGEFVNLYSSRVYQYFDRQTHHVDITLADYPNADLWIGMDFNIDKMAAVIGIFLPNKLIIVDELIGTKEAPIRDTPEMIRRLKARYQGRRIHVCPDSSGQNRDTAGWETDLTLLSKEGWTLHHKKVQPAIDLRIANANRMLYNATLSPPGSPGLYVNTKMCPLTLRTLEQQPWDKNDKPLKDGEIDHASDAMCYLVMETFGARLAQATNAPWRH